MSNEKQRHFLWDYHKLVQHRSTKFRKALRRRDDEYLKARQEKLGRVLPKSLFTQAKITFLDRGIADDNIQSN